MFITSPVLAANGKKLLNDCNNVIKYQQNKSDKTVSVLGAGLCYGYIGSTIDTHASLTEFFNRENLFCSPSNLKGGDFNVSPLAALRRIINPTPVRWQGRSQF